MSRSHNTVGAQNKYILIHWDFLHHMLSCHGTDPAGLLKYSFRHSLSCLALVVSLVGPLACSMSCMLALHRQSPGMRLPLASSWSTSAWWWQGYLVHIMLCSYVHVLTMSCTVSVLSCMMVRRTCQGRAIMPNAFSTTLRPRDMYMAFVWKNASKWLQMSYVHYKCLAINKNVLRLLTKILRKQ